jgi:hypothetical protein
MRAELVLEAHYAGATMESAARNIRPQYPARHHRPGPAPRPVKTSLGPTAGRLTLRHAGGELARARVHFDIHFVPLRAFTLEDERGRRRARLPRRRGRPGLFRAARRLGPHHGHDRRLLLPRRRFV